MTLGVCVSGTSILHRAGAGGKLMALAGVGIAVSVIDSGLVLALALAGLIALWAVAGLTWDSARTLLRPLVWFLAPIAVFHLWVSGPGSALSTVLAIVVVVMSAGLVSLTTRPTDMLAVLARVLEPLRRWRVSPETVAFAITFLARLLPMVAEIGHETGDAIRARGGRRTPRAFLIPFSIRVLRQSDALAEALDARGFADRVR